MANTPTTDLVDIYTNALSSDIGTGTWAEPSRDGTGGTPILDEEIFIQGTSCMSQACRRGRTGRIGACQLDLNTDITAFSDGSHVFMIWWLFLFPEALNDYNNATNQGLPTNNAPGTRNGWNFALGSSNGNLNTFPLGAANYGSYPYGGWQNSAVDPTITANIINVQGSPTSSNYSVFEFYPVADTVLNRGQTWAIDAIRYGRASIEYTGGAPAGTFTEIATTNDLQNNRWGIFQKVQGGFLFKGRLSLGTSAASLLFSDANKNIVIDDTRLAYNDFNRIEVRNTASSITLENITINKVSALDSGVLDNARGNFEMVDNAATMVMNGCSLNDMGTFIFQSNGDLDDTTFRRCDQVTQGGASFVNCSFETTRAAVALLSTITTANNIERCSFTGDGTSHAVDIGNVTTSTSINWSSSFNASTYAATNQAQNAASTPGDSEVILVNVSSGQTLTINLAAGISSPTYRNTGPGTVLIVQSVSFVISNVVDGSEIDVIDRDTGTQLATVETIGASPVGVNSLVVAADPNNAGRFQASYAYSGSDAPINAKIVVMNFDYQHYAQNVTLGSSDGGLLVSQIIDRNYLDPD